MKEKLLQKIQAIAERVAAGEGLEVVEVEFLGSGKNRVLRIYIDKAEGVTHADCERVSHQVSAILDAEDVVPGARYTLEISSPGVERKLSKARDFERFVGQKARLVLKQPIRESRRWEGVLAGFADGVIQLEPKPGDAVAIPLEQVEKANLKFEW